MRHWLSQVQAKRWPADVFMAALIVAGAVWLFLRAYPTADLLWRDPLHDRNSHYLLGLEMALSMRELDPVTWLSRLDKTQIWPPVHPLVLSFVLLLGGIDHRLGMVPSLIGWAMTLWFSWLIMRDSFADRMSGAAAGLIALALIATSPALALISTDVMLEGLGSGLSALCLWAFMRAWRERASESHWKMLALSLTTLFFEKYNYWAFAVTAIAISAFVIDAQLRRTVREIVVIAARNATRLVFRPFFIAGAAVLLLAMAIGLRGPTVVYPFGLRISLYPPGGIVTVAYVLMFVAAVETWRVHGAGAKAVLGRPGTIMLAWLVLPVAVSFLIPKRLSNFIWFVGPSNGSSSMHFDPLGGAVFYVHAFVDGFVSVAPIGWIMQILFAAAILLSSRLRPEARVVLVFTGVALLAMIAHPQHQARFLSTVIFALSCGAALGAVLLMRFVVAQRVTLIAAGAVTVAVLATGWRMPTPDAAYDIAIRQRDGASQAVLVDRVRPRLEPGRPVAVTALFGHSGLVRWPLEEACRCMIKFDEFWTDSMADRSTVAAAAAAWLANTRAGQAVIVDLPGIYGAFYRYEDLAGILDAVAAQTRFTMTSETGTPQDGGRVISLTRR